MLNVDSRNLFLLDPEVVYLNHGAFGATPREVLDEKIRILSQIEKNPVSIFQHTIRAQWRCVADRIAQRFSLEPNSVAIVDNATDGINAVLRSLSLKPGDEMLLASMTYGAVAIAARYIAKKHGAAITLAELRFPRPDPEQCVEAVTKALTSRTKIAILDHITSSTALLMPLVAMIAACHDKEVPVLVDGAHTPGHIALDISALSADWYVGNLHKWYFVPRGCGFLWAAPGCRSGLMPNVFSWDIDYPFPSNFGWTGTRDPSSWLAVPAAFDFMDRFGENEVRQHNHQLIRQAVSVLSDMWKFPVTTPDSMTASMTLVPTPDGLPYPPTQDGRERLEADLKNKDNIVVNPAFAHKGKIWLRITAQIYNRIEDYEKLGKAVMALRASHDRTRTATRTN
jgi:isopenicillin-N epimerase